MMQSAQLGQSYLIPYKVDGSYKVQFQIGYKGLLELVNRSGKLKTLYAYEVKENDEFDIDYGFTQKLIHKLLLKGDRGEVIGYYFVFMTYDEVKNHGKKYSKNFEGGVWERKNKKKKNIKKNTNMLIVIFIVRIILVMKI